MVRKIRKHTFAAVAVVVGPTMSGKNDAQPVALEKPAKSDNTAGQQKPLLGPESASFFPIFGPIDQW